MICYYILTHPASGVFYIGSTCNFKKRLRTHFNRLRACTHHAKLLQEVYNFIPGLEYVTFDAETTEVAKTKEYELIAMHKGNHLLANSQGNDGYVLTEARVNANLSRRGSTLSDTAKAKISAVHKGKVLSTEAKARISSMNTGRPPPDGHIERLAAINSSPVSIAGRIYSSQKEAAISHGLSSGGVRRRIQSDKWIDWIHHSDKLTD